MSVDKFPFPSCIPSTGGLFNHKIDFLKVLRSKHRESLDESPTLWMGPFLLLRNRLWVDGVVDVSDAVNAFLDPNDPQESGG